MVHLHSCTVYSVSAEVRGGSPAIGYSGSMALRVTRSHRVLADLPCRGTIQMTGRSSREELCVHVAVVGY
jgi:hypothetical protein